MMLHYSNFQAVKSYLAYAQDQANNERLPQPASLDYTWPIVGGIAVLLALIIGLIVFAARRRRKPTTTVEPALPVAPAALADTWQAIEQPAPTLQPVGGPSEVAGATFEVPSSNNMLPYHELPTSMVPPQDGMAVPPPQPFSAETEEQEMSAASTQPYPAVKMPPASSEAPTE